MRMGNAEAPEGASRERVNALITACWTTQVIAEAVRLGLPERLSAGAADSAALPSKRGTRCSSVTSPSISADRPRSAESRLRRSRALPSAVPPVDSRNG